MIIQTIETVPRPSAWVLSPGCLIDRLLDQIEKLRRFIALVETDISNSEAQRDARPGSFGA